MALVLTERTNSTTMIGDTWLSIGRTKRGELRIVIDAPQDDLIVCSRNLKKALTTHSWILEEGAFYATHSEHGRKHLRDLVHLLKDESRG